MINYDINYYHQALLKSPKAALWLGLRGVHRRHVLRENHIGLYTHGSDHETIGSLAIPYLNDDNQLAAINVVYMFDDDIPTGTYGDKWIGNPDGVLFNSRSIQMGSTLFLCENAIDAMGCICHGYPCASYVKDQMHFLSVLPYLEKKRLQWLVFMARGTRNLALPACVDIAVASKTIPDGKPAWKYASNSLSRF